MSGSEEYVLYFLIKRDVFFFVFFYVIKYLCKLVLKVIFFLGVVEFGFWLLFLFWEFFWFEFKKLDWIFVSVIVKFFFVLNVFVNSLIDDIEYKYIGWCRIVFGE